MKSFEPKTSYLQCLHHPHPISPLPPPPNTTIYIDTADLNPKPSIYDVFNFTTHNQSPAPPKQKQLTLTQPIDKVLERENKNKKRKTKY